MNASVTIDGERYELSWTTAYRVAILTIPKLDQTETPERKNRSTKFARNDNWKAYRRKASQMLEQIYFWSRESDKMPWSLVRDLPAHWC